jgi:pimeloyl-ACP methyl ester carboxylesterase
MGSVLKTPQGEEVWPPNPSEVVFGYDRLDQLLRDDLRATDIIRKVSCFNVYQPLIATLGQIGFREDDRESRLDIFCYDWRRDLEQTARHFSDHLNQLVRDGASSIVIVAHSMGGLVSRLALESPTFRGQAWFSQVQALFTLATPHRGAPLALARILGLDSCLGLSGDDIKRLAADPRYPSAYQLLPAPGEDACWDVTAPRLAPLNIYDGDSATRIGLNPSLVARAKFVHDSLATGQRPDHVRYFTFGATGHKTVTRVNLTAEEMTPTTTGDAGDGTVPMWSAFGPVEQKQLVRGEHASMFTGEEFDAVFWRLFGKDYPAPPLKLASRVRLSVHDLVIPCGEEIEVLLVPDQPTPEIRGGLTLAFTEDPDRAFTVVDDPMAISYSGPDVPHLRLLLPGLERPGHYQLGYQGAPGPGEPVLFSVQQR